MKYKIINLLLKAPVLIGRIFGFLLRGSTKFIKIKIASLGGLIVSMPISKLRPIAYFFFYELLKEMTNGEQLILKKNISEKAKMILDVSQKTQRQVYLYDSYEKPIRLNIEKELKRGDVFFDIGSNTGYYTIIAGFLVGDEGRVFSFEPEERNFRSLEKNVRINKLQNVILENKAVGENGGLEVLYLNPMNEGGHSLLEMKTFSDNEASLELNEAKNKYKNFEFKQNVEVVCMDDYLEKHQDIEFVRFLKIDVEGFEASVIEGMRRRLNRGFFKNIICEINDPSSGAIQTLRSYGYRSYEMDKNGELTLVEGPLSSRRNYLFKK